MPRSEDCALVLLHLSVTSLTELLPAIFFVPEVLKQSVTLHKLEAEAVAQNQSPQTVSEAYVISRGHFRRKAKLDAVAWTENRNRLRDEKDRKAALRRTLRRSEYVTMKSSTIDCNAYSIFLSIDAKLIALGFATAE